MSDPNPPEQPSFNRPAGSDPTTPLPSSQPASPAPGSGSPPPPPPMVPAAPTGGPGGMSSIPDPATEGAGFFTALFDFSFTNFVTPILVRFVYLLATVALVATWLIFVFVGFANSVGTGLAALDPRPGLRHHLPRRHPHDPRVLPLGRAHERGHPQATPPGLTPIERAVRRPALGGPRRNCSFDQRAGCCWVMQWMPPPRSKSGRASTPTTRRPGYASPRIARDASSCSSPNEHAMTPSLTTRWLM